MTITSIVKNILKVLGWIPSAFTGMVGIINLSDNEIISGCLFLGFAVLVAPPLWKMVRVNGWIKNPAALVLFLSLIMISQNEEKKALLNPLEAYCKAEKWVEADSLIQKMSRKTVQASRLANLVPLVDSAILVIKTNEIESYCKTEKWAEADSVLQKMTINSLPTTRLSAIRSLVDSGLVGLRISKAEELIRSSKFVEAKEILAAIPKTPASLYEKSVQGMAQIDSALLYDCLAARISNCQKMLDEKKWGEVVDSLVQFPEDHLLSATAYQLRRKALIGEFKQDLDTGNYSSAISGFSAIKKESPAYDSAQYLLYVAKYEYANQSFESQDYDTAIERLSGFPVKHPYIVKAKNLLALAKKKKVTRIEEMKHKAVESVDNGLDIEEPDWKTDLTVVKSTWDYEGVANWSVKVRNFSKSTAYKDLKFKCKYYGASGTLVASTIFAKQVYEIIGPGKTHLFKFSELGHSQAKSAEVELVKAFVVQ